MAAANEKIIITRKWAMPSKHTFTIKPIRHLLNRYQVGKGWIDPFAGYNSPAELTNDINESTPAMFHLDAESFLKTVEGLFVGALFDPPYSLRQLKECYDGLGKHLTQRDSQGSTFESIKDGIASKVRVGGFVISFGWNSQGLSKRRGFRIIEILLVNHGRGHYDTIVTVEQKVSEQLSMNLISKN